MKVVIFGAGGNLGKDLVRAFSDANHNVVGYDRDSLDATDANAVRDCIGDGRFDVVVNAVAWNNVDAAEDPANRDAVWRLNVTVPQTMAEAAKDSGAMFVHYSTDYVFAGTKPEGYTEDDAPNPVSVYGQSKSDGDRAVVAVDGRSYICRTSKLFGAPGSSSNAKPSFVNVMVRLARTKPELGIVDEEVGSPTYTRDLAEATVRLTSGAYAPGVYHVVNEGPPVTWYGFAEEFFGLLNISTPRKPVTSAAFPKPAKRPKFAPLINTKFPKLRSREDALRAYFAEALEKL